MALSIASASAATWSNGILTTSSALESRFDVGTHSVQFDRAAWKTASVNHTFFSILAANLVSQSSTQSSDQTASTTSIATEFTTAATSVEIPEAPGDTHDAFESPSRNTRSSAETGGVSPLTIVAIVVPMVVGLALFLLMLWVIEHRLRHSGTGSGFCTRRLPSKKHNARPLDASQRIKRWSDRRWSDMSLEAGVVDGVLRQARVDDGPPVLPEMASLMRSNTFAIRPSMRHLPSKRTVWELQSVSLDDSAERAGSWTPSLSQDTAKPGSALCQIADDSARRRNAGPELRRWRSLSATNVRFAADWEARMTPRHEVGQALKRDWMRPSRILDAVGSCEREGDTMKEAVTPVRKDGGDRDSMKEVVM